MKVKDLFEGILEEDNNKRIAYLRDSIKFKQERINNPNIGKYSKEQIEDMKNELEDNKEELKKLQGGK